MEKHVDVTVIGGGISGLTAAYHLHKKDPALKICVLEAKDRVGGRTLTLPLKCKDGGTDHWDLGGQWVSTSQKDIMALLEELGLETYPQFTTGSKVMQVESAKIQSYKSDIPSLSPFELIDLQLFIWKVERLRKQVDHEDPYNCSKGEEWDTKTLETFLKESLWTRGAYETVAAAIRTTVTMEPSQMSTLYFLSLVSSAGGLMILMEANEDAAQGLKVKGGTQQISKILAEKVGTDNVLLEHAVTKVIQNEKSIQLKCRNGLTVSCKRAVMAAPPMVARKIQFEPQLSLQRREIEKWMPFGNYIKVIVTYQEAFWRSNGQSGEAVTYGGPSDVSGCDVGPLSIVFDATTPTGSPALVAFLAGDQAIQWGRQKAHTRKNAVLKTLTDFFGSQAESCLDYFEKDWSEELFIEGAVAAVSTGAMRNFAAGLREPQGRLHFAGSESAREWDGYMSGAVQAGIRAATEILHQLRPGSVSSGELFGTAYSPSYKAPQHLRRKVKQSYITRGLSFAILVGVIALLYRIFVSLI
ncbi:probable flavin-containing monoamine oxidase A [Mizuhopecten yessoensis]|uniref:Amine oxidase n=1 Tax=Mizuhopecten yessoensis TaxID=6573 RepID=A0A210PUE0_MIZYE|nr:probable flavin-containing monoamine oxidase A [Mizuhopecten yessoensis]OWF40103.1 flavin-containing monoamine oxidase A [Mizuhopecten yessoensis]